MKQLLPLLVCSFLVTNVNGQPTDTTYNLPSRNFNRIGKTQIVVGAVFTIAGLTGLALTATAQTMDNAIGSLDGWWGGNAATVQEPSYSVYYVASAITTVCGILFLAAAKGSRAKAKDISLNLGLQPANPFGYSRNGTLSQAAVSCQIPIRAKGLK